MGIFLSLRPFPWIGPYHGEDVIVMFGAFKVANPTVDPSLAEIAASKFFQNVLATFIRDPATGLTRQYGWPTYDPNAKTLIELLPNVTAAGVLADPNTFDQACSTVFG
jgi:hypothetical protein